MGGCGQAHLYDAESLQCFTPSVSESHHTGGINQAAMQVLGLRCANLVKRKEFAPDLSSAHVNLGTRARLWPGGKPPSDPRRVKPVAQFIKRDSTQPVQERGHIIC